MLACLALTIGRVHVDIHSEVDPRRVTVGDPATGRIVVRNLARTPLLPLLVELPVGVTAARFVMPPMRAGAEHEELFVVPTHRRGVIAVGPARTVRGDPLGVLRRTVEFSQVQELFVHPRTSHLESLGAGLLRDLEGTITEDHSMSDLAFHALREYQPGDDRRYIHWRSSAKAGRLLVRQFLDTRRSHVTVLVDTDPRSYTGGEDILDEWTGEHTEPLVAAHSAPEIPDLETAISVGASIVLRVMRDEQDTTIVCGSHDISRRPRSSTLDVLARVVPAPADLYRPRAAGRRPRRRHEHPLRRHRSAPAVRRAAAGRRAVRPRGPQRHRRRRPGRDRGHQARRRPDHPHRDEPGSTCAASWPRGWARDRHPARTRAAVPVARAPPRSWPAGGSGCRPRRSVSTSSSRRRSSCSPWSASARPTTGTRGLVVGGVGVVLGLLVSHLVVSRRWPAVVTLLALAAVIPPARRPDRGARRADRRGGPHAGGDRSSWRRRRSAAGRPSSPRCRRSTRADR